MSRFKIKIDPLDQLFSLYIRARDGWRCQVCQRVFTETERSLLQCSHFMSRRHMGTRWDEGNACAKCSTCHDRMTGDPITFTNWIMSRLGGQTFALLQMKARKVTRVSAFDKDMIARELLAKLGMIEGGEVMTKARKYAGSVAAAARKGVRRRELSKIMPRAGRC